MRRIIALIILFGMALTTVTIGIVFLVKGNESRIDTLEYDFLSNYSYLTDENNVLKKIDYDNMMSLVNSKKSFILYLGGEWCPNCQAAVPFINEIAKTKDIDIVYNCDIKDIRGCETEEAKAKYSDFVFKIDYVNPTGRVITNSSSENILAQNGSSIPRIAVPTVFAFKEGKMVGFVTKEYIYEDMTDQDKADYRTLLGNLFDLVK